MSDLADRVEQTRELIEPNWTPERESRVRGAVLAGLQRQRRRRTALAVAAGAAILLLGIFLGRRETAVARAPMPEAPVLVRLVDGSVVTALSTDARVESVAIGPHAVTLQLDKGSAHFVVTPNPERPFRVLAGEVTVTVLGTIFDVTIEPTGVRVGVERGRVRVTSQSDARELGAGQAGFFAITAPAAAPSAAPVPAIPEVEVTDLADVAARPGAHAAPSWRALAQEGAYGPAFARLAAEGPNAVRDTPEDLLLAADVARLGGHPERAVPLLERVMSGHPFDSRAPLAAFTLGRTLLEQLGRPRPAARAFATARQLDRAGALTQDALAREVEAWSRAGEAEKARERANEYLKRYPTGRRAAAVRRLGGLE